MSTVSKILSSILHLCCLGLVCFVCFGLACIWSFEPFIEVRKLVHCFITDASTSTSYVAVGIGKLWPVGIVDDWSIERYANIYMQHEASMPHAFRLFSPENGVLAKVVQLHGLARTAFAFLVYLVFFVLVDFALPYSGAVIDALRASLSASGKKSWFQNTFSYVWQKTVTYRCMGFYCTVLCQSTQLHYSVTHLPCVVIAFVLGSLSYFKLVKQPSETDMYAYRLCKAFTGFIPLSFFVGAVVIFSHNAYTDALHRDNLHTQMQMVQYWKDAYWKHTAHTDALHQQMVQYWEDAHLVKPSNETTPNMRSGTNDTFVNHTFVNHTFVNDTVCDPTTHWESCWGFTNNVFLTKFGDVWEWKWPVWCQIAD